jgi:hypothetical protein
MRQQFGVVAVAGLSVLALAGCGGRGNTVSAGSLRSYVTAVEAVRLPVNTLLNGADPILDAYHEHQITPAQAAQKMGALEQQFAGYTLAMQQVSARGKALTALNTPYAQTYFFEDSYLATLASDLNDGSFENLPNTQDAQRLAIIRWRVQLEVLAAKAHVTLPADIQQAGRGEIAPSLDG